MKEIVNVQSVATTWTIPELDKNEKNHRMTWGGKGANLIRMSAMGLNVPAAFIIPTDYCSMFENVKQFPQHIDGMYYSAHKQVDRLATSTGKKFGSYTKDNPPLLVSVRSGAAISMPGMMNTILNLGINEDIVERIAQDTSEAFAWDCYRRFIEMYGETVLEVEANKFRDLYSAMQTFYSGAQIPAGSLKRLVVQYKKMIDRCGKQIPDSPSDQLIGAIEAVFASWNSPRAQAYRKVEGIDDSIGTAVTVQQMVYGNYNNNSGTGVAFTRNPNTGVNERFGDFLINAQGEDVVNGTAHPVPLKNLHSVMPSVAKELEDTMNRLEQRFHDMCDIEFTIEDGKLYMLQVRSGKRSSTAAVRIAVDMAVEGMITSDESVKRIAAVNVRNPESTKSVSQGELLGKGQGAVPGRVTGIVALTPAYAVQYSEAGLNVILVREETSPEDIAGISASAGIVTAKGGLVSHAAVVCRGWDKPCVVGFSELVLHDPPKRHATVGEQRINPGDIISLDGATGEVFFVKARDEDAWDCSAYKNPLNELLDELT